MVDIALEKASFRDRRARVYRHEGEIYRCLDATAWQQWLKLKETVFFAQLSQDGSIPKTTEVDLADLDFLVEPGVWAGALRHEIIPVISYPYEWSFGRLKDAALFHLQLLEQALDEGWILKDSSAYNIQWHGGRAIFIDIPSFEPLQPGEPWVGYKQFCEMFLNPLILSAYKGVRFQQWMRGRVDGIETREMAGLMSFWDNFRSGVLGHITLHAKLQRSMEGSQVSKSSIQKAGFNPEIIRANLRGLAKTIFRLESQSLPTHWLDYAKTHSYSETEYQQKKHFIEQVCSAQKHATVWDMGCNTGDFSRIAAAHGAYVIAMDADESAVEALYQRSKREGDQRIISLVMNLADPSPALGWRGQERMPLPQRGAPDLVLALALIHHMVFSANVPPRDFVQWLAELGGAVVLEFVAKEDEMVQTLLKNKEDLHPDYNQGQFEAYLGQFFEIRHTHVLKGNLRKLYHLVPLPPA